MQTPQPLRFHLNSSTNTVVDELTGERHQFDTYEQAWFARGRLEREHKAPATSGTKMQKRAEREQGGQRA
jgi:hypothetical protein